MTQAWGVAIPGLAMHSGEIPQVPGLIALQNPDVGNGVEFNSSYSLFDVADVHLNSIVSLISTGALIREDLWIIGMSMGGMINSILASTLRSKLPVKVNFAFLVTTPNLPSNRAVPDCLLDDWRKAQPGCIEDFKQILSPFFSDQFLRENPSTALNYFEYRAFGKNEQTPKAFFKQLAALRQFNGEHTFPKINPTECVFIGGEKDLILGPDHNKDLRSLSPESRHFEIKNLGHMINLEKPELFNLRTA